MLNLRKVAAASAPAVLLPLSERQNYCADGKLPRGIAARGIILGYDRPGDAPGNTR